MSLCSTHKGVDKGIRNVVKNRPNGFFDQAIRKLVLKAEIDLTGSFAQSMKVPFTVQLVERAVLEMDAHGARALFAVAR